MSTEIKPMCLIRGPASTRSGYGVMTRQIARQIIDYGKYDVKIHSVPWGDTPTNALNENDPRDKVILDRILKENLTKQPELFIVVSVPNEFEPMGKYNIGITAGIETTAVSVPWIEGCNRMNAVFTISQHSKDIFEHSKFKYTPANSLPKVLEVTTPVEIWPCCVDTDVFGKKAPTDSALTKTLDALTESYAFLFVGHWLPGEYGEDRKNVSFLIKLFLETFKQITDQKLPALIVKTCAGGFSVLDQEQIIAKIEQIKSSVELVGAQKLPNVYLLHGDMTDTEMNTLYNHPKIKTHVSFTKGEGFGLPLLEASVSGKPVIASGWSGHMDFLNVNNSILVGGELKPVHPSAAWENVIMESAQWFSPDPQQSMNAFAAAFLDYKQFKDRAYDLMIENRVKFSYESVREIAKGLLDKYVPEFPKQVAIVLPKLKKREAPTGKSIVIENAVTE